VDARKTKPGTNGHFPPGKINRILFRVLLVVALLACTTGAFTVVRQMLAEYSRQLQNGTGQTMIYGSDPGGSFDNSQLIDSSALDDSSVDSLTPPPDDPDALRIYLTFDDGPSTVSTQRILEILDDYGIKATFFVLGYQAEYYPDIVRLVDSRGHVIANHSYSHDYTTIYRSADAFMTDISRCESVLTEILGRQPARILRFPAGSAATQLENNPTIRNTIKNSLADGGWRYFDWNASMGDSWAGGSPQPGELGTALISYIDGIIAQGYTDIVVLAHDTNSRPWTPADLPMVIEYCQARGYVFKTLSIDSPPCQYR
jgi:peptidoglycan/xylan/chitin deacetylase (PgdA/CDA1 family)